MSFTSLAAVALRFSRSHFRSFKTSSSPVASSLRTFMSNAHHLAPSYELRRHLSSYTHSRPPASSQTHSSPPFPSRKNVCCRVTLSPGAIHEERRVECSMLLCYMEARVYVRVGRTGSTERYLQCGGVRRWGSLFKGEECGKRDGRRICICCVEWQVTC